MQACNRKNIAKDIINIAIVAHAYSPTVEANHDPEIFNPAIPARIKAACVFP
jgi:hypothetical protein